jgi:hypothetical protein
MTGLNLDIKPHRLDARCPSHAVWHRHHGGVLAVVAWPTSSLHSMCCISSWVNSHRVFARPADLVPFCRATQSEPDWKNARSARHCFELGWKRAPRMDMFCFTAVVVVVVLMMAMAMAMAMAMVILLIPLLVCLGGIGIFKLDASRRRGGGGACTQGGDLAACPSLRLLSSFGVERRRLGMTMMMAMACAGEKLLEANKGRKDLGKAQSSEEVRGSLGSETILESATLATPRVEQTFAANNRAPCSVLTSDSGCTQLKTVVLGMTLLIERSRCRPLPDSAKPPSQMLNVECALPLSLHFQTRCWHNHSK